MSLSDAFRYDGKRALVVGGATGMGAATAELVQDAGAEVVVMDYADVKLPGVKAVHLNLADKASIDAAVDAQQVIVVAPIAGRVMGPIGRTAGFLLARELQTWRNRHPGATIVVIRPNIAIARLAGRHPLALFDADRARQVYPLAVAQGLQWGERLQSATAA